MSGQSGFDAATLERFADLLVGFGANIQPGQILSVSGEIGSIPASAEGCPFRSRCPMAMAKCTETPPWITIAPDHQSRCWLDAKG